MAHSASEVIVQLNAMADGTDNRLPETIGLKMFMRDNATVVLDSDGREGELELNSRMFAWFLYRASANKPFFVYWGDEGYKIQKRDRMVMRGHKRVQHYGKYFWIFTIAFDPDQVERSAPTWEKVKDRPVAPIGWRLIEAWPTADGPEEGDDATMEDPSLKFGTQESGEFSREVITGHQGMGEDRTGEPIVAAFYKKMRTCLIDIHAEISQNLRIERKCEFNWTNIGNIIVSILSKKNKDMVRKTDYKYRWFMDNSTFSEQVEVDQPLKEKIWGIVTKYFNNHFMENNKDYKDRGFNLPLLGGVQLNIKNEKASKYQQTRMLTEMSLSAASIHLTMGSTLANSYKNSRPRICGPLVHMYALVHSDEVIDKLRPRGEGAQNIKDKLRRNVKNSFISENQKLIALEWCENNLLTPTDKRQMLGALVASCEVIKPKQQHLFVLTPGMIANASEHEFNGAEMSGRWVFNFVKEHLAETILLSNGSIHSKRWATQVQLMRIFSCLYDDLTIWEQLIRIRVSGTDYDWMVRRDVGNLGKGGCVPFRPEVNVLGWNSAQRGAPRNLGVSSSQQGGHLNSVRGPRDVSSQAPLDILARSAQYLLADVENLMVGLQEDVTLYQKKVLVESKDKLTMTMGATAILDQPMELVAKQQPKLLFAGFNDTAPTPLHTWDEFNRDEYERIRKLGEIGREEILKRKEVPFGRNTRVDKRARFAQS